MRTRVIFTAYCLVHRCPWPGVTGTAEEAERASKAHTGDSVKGDGAHHPTATEGTPK